MSVRLARTFSSAAEAERLWRSVAADNPAYVVGRLDGPELLVEVRGSSAASVRETVDDLVACLAAAERAEAPGSVRAGAPARPPSSPGSVDRRSAVM